MLDLKYAFKSNVSRSESVSCWCPPWQSIVQFGGIPPSEELQTVLNEGGGSGKLYYLTVNDIKSGIDAVEKSRIEKKRKRDKRTNGLFPSLPPSYLPAFSATKKKKVSLLDGEDITLKWRVVPGFSPRDRRGHAFIYCRESLYLIGGCYWAHGNTMARADMVFNTKTLEWRKIDGILLPHAQAAVSVSNCRNSDGEVAVYFFGGVRSPQPFSNEFYRIFLPSRTSESLPQMGDVPPPQLKGFIVCDVSYEVSATESSKGKTSEGYLYLGDGLCESDKTQPALRMYNLNTGMWRKIALAPKLMSGQVISRCYDAISGGLKRFILFGAIGQVSSDGRNGKKMTFKKKPSYVFSFDAANKSWKKQKATCIRGICAHAAVQLPSSGKNTSPEKSIIRDGIVSISVGGNQDVFHISSRRIGEPMGWVCLFAPTPVPLRDSAAYGYKYYKKQKKIC
ncbi:hypothetical protein LSM04_000939 [Trypanosoma melophagium]|uniref:uncharacterized protein n=1 Tax=Trypanosoma melophagium TaxID=715481 RepID=UPI00351A076E|nr:hypothetical protein LSM04_000939 [Trypanosoma melophagium]